SEPSKEVEMLEYSREIAVISGGLDAMMTRVQRKRYERQAAQVLLSESSVPPPKIISFIQADFRTDIFFPHEDPLVIEVKILDTNVPKVLVDTGSSADIISWECIKKLKVESSVIPLITPVSGFGGHLVRLKG